VPHYLLGHAIELFLKAFLSAESVPELRLRDLGHDLTAVLSEAERASLSQHVSLSVGERQIIETLNPFYSTKELEYSTMSAGEGRLVTLHEPKAIQAVASKLMRVWQHCVAQTIKQREAKKAGHTAGGTREESSEGERTTSRGEGA